MKTLKNAAVFLVITGFGMALTYACGALGGASTNPADWPIDYRESVAACGTMLSVGAGVIAVAIMNGA